MFPLWLMSCLLLEKNGRCFEEKEFSMKDLRDFFFRTSFWAKRLVLNEDNILDLILVFLFRVCIRYFFRILPIYLDYAKLVIKYCYYLSKGKKKGPKEQ